MMMDQRLLEAPVLGVGLGIDLLGEKPDVPSLLKQSQRFDFLEVFTRGRAGSELCQTVVDSGLPIIYHHENIEPCVPQSPDPETLQVAAANMNTLNAHWCVEELAFRHFEGQYLDFFLPVILTEESLDVTVSNLKQVKDHLPAPLVVENPPFECVAGTMGLGDWLTALCHKVDNGLVCDLGHLISWSIATGIDVREEFQRFPLDRVVELHVAGADFPEELGECIYVDSHGESLIPRQTLDLLAWAAPQVPHLKAITLEVEGAAWRRCREELHRVKHLIKQQGVFDAPA